MTHDEAAEILESRGIDATENPDLVASLAFWTNHNGCENQDEIEIQNARQNDPS